MQCENVHDLLEVIADNIEPFVLILTNIIALFVHPPLRGPKNGKTQETEQERLATSFQRNVRKNSQDEH